MVARRGTRCHVLQCNVPHVRTEVQLLVSSERHAAAVYGERARGAGVCGGAGRGGPYARIPPPPASSPMHSASSVVLWMPSTPDSQATTQPASEGAAGQGQEGTDTAGTGEGGGGGQEGAEPGELKATGQHTDPFKPAERERPGGSIVPITLEVLEEEREGAERMAVAGGHRQPTAPNVPAAAMKLMVLAGKGG